MFDQTSFIYMWTDANTHSICAYVSSCIQVDVVFEGTSCFLAIICEQQLSLSSSVTVIKMFKTAQQRAEICHLESEYTLISLPFALQTSLRMASTLC